jgi:hypothetical protein
MGSVSKGLWEKESIFSFFNFSKKIVIFWNKHPAEIQAMQILFIIIIKTYQEFLVATK